VEHAYHHFQKSIPNPPLITFPIPEFFEGIKAMDNAPSLGWPKWVFPTLLMSFLVCILLIADWVYWREYALIRAEKIADLKSISRMKSGEILSWRKERISDAVTEAEDPFLRNALAHWMAHPTNQILKRDIIGELRDEYSSNQYLNAYIINPDGKILLAIHPLHGGLGYAEHHLVEEAIKVRHVLFGDFTKDPRTGDIHIDVAAPIIGPRGVPEAALMLWLNPQATIYPLIETWPTESKTAETLLVEKQGDEAVFLNTLRHSTLPPLSMRIPLSRINVPAVRAVLGGTGIYEGPDYRGTDVVAVIHPLKPTPWCMVTKVDRSEILADVRYWRDVVIVVALLAMAVACIGTALLYIHHDRVLYRAYYHSERERTSALEEIRATLYHIGDGVIATDSTGCITRMNPQAETLTGWSEKDAVGRPLQEVFNIIHEGTRMKVDNPATTVLKNGVVVGLGNHTTLIAKDGAERPIADSGAPIRNSDGDITGVVIVFRDQTEERRLQDYNRRLASIVEHAINEVYVFDTETLHFSYANRAALENLGYTFEEMRKLTPLDIKPEFTKESFMQKLSPLLSDETTSLVFETLHLRCDGTTYPVWLSLTKTDPGDKGAIIAIGQNITEYKRMEEQLRQAHKMESVGRLAGGVAHDFNNMLGVILGHAEMALERIDQGKPVSDNLNEILKATKRSADLTRQLLAFARRQTINPVVLDLNETVAGMLKMLRRLIGEDIELIWKPGRSLWHVKIDPAQVDQTLMNLIVNARDAISNVGTITIETSNVVLDEVYCQTHAETPPGEYVLLTVSDTGIGMDKETLDHIFEPFYSTKEVGKGTGLGLAMIYGIVRQNHGYLTVYSEQGNGTCFKIYLPRTYDSKRAMKDVANDRVTAGVETVLVVEDEEAILNLCKDVLEQQGYKAIAFSTANEAIRFAETYPDPLHLLITDIVMPDMNGKELAERIGAIRPNMKVLYMSGYTASSIEHKGVLDKGMHYLPKPFSIRHFAEKVRETLDS
jgi:two-component system cell cycle sensor histidine kinase/response regulator CckA